MKKLLLIITALVMNISLFAQSPKTEAPDFVATDHYGEQVHLYDILDRGQYVLIDFFYINCYYCDLWASNVVEAYHTFGCNDYDVFFMEISPEDSNSALHTWCNEHEIEYPTIGVSGGGNDIINAYGIYIYPALVLISPDRQIVAQDVSSNTAQNIINTLTSYGINPHACDGGGSSGVPEVAVNIDGATPTTMTVSYTPNADCASYAVFLEDDEEMALWMDLMGWTPAQIVHEWGTVYEESATHTWTLLNPGVEYNVYALPMDAEGNCYALQTLRAATPIPGGTGTSQIDVQVEVLSETEVTTTSTPNAETASFYMGILTKELFDQLGEEGAVQRIRDYTFAMYDIDIFTWTNLTPYSHYYAIATGKNANGEWGEAAIVEFYTDPSFVAVDENEAAKFAVFPNPANDMVKISGEGIESVEVFNSLGQKMNVALEKGADVIIPTQAFEGGVYFVRINGNSTIRFVVTH